MQAVALLQHKTFPGDARIPPEYKRTTRCYHTDRHARGQDVMTYGVIVRPFREWFSSLVIEAGYFRWVVGEVVDSAGCEVNPSVRNSAQNYIVCDVYIINESQRSLPCTIAGSVYCQNDRSVPRTVNARPATSPVLVFAESHPESNAKSEYVDPAWSCNSRMTAHLIMQQV